MSAGGADQQPVTALDLIEEAALADLGTFAGRAKTLDPDGAMRLVVVGQVLAGYVCVVPPGSLNGAGTVLGLRTYAVRAAGPLDVTVPLGAVTDRVHRRGAGSVLPVPPMTVSAPWAGMAPPRTGWSEPVEVPEEILETSARAGIEAVAAGAPEGAGSAAVAQLRRRVWSTPMPLPEPFPDGRHTMPSGLAFAAHVLGFGAPGLLRTAGAWWRLSGPGGHALAR